ncbi:ABC transporter ATP-binding protein [Paenibacillus donghaensis]|uniref:ABC transporter n=1 Tax=Paenibacillus donghaensis TaxID=414771 RepID=A0A2Z2KL91_9BACL|nr:ABC transporter ATP-binding protein [Paenibacillus donghaensis]ASA23229.1 ABC transporter [Paenibacillus donghaensis]
MGILLAFDQIEYYYKVNQQTVNILNDASYNFYSGKMYAILGPSGSGKTTALALAGGLDVPSGGRILYEGQDISRIGLSNYRKMHRAVVFQSYNLIPYLSALQNVRVGMEIRGNTGKEKKRKALEILQNVGLTQVEAQRNVLKLSGGQQQRVAIARALACDVNLILADEPTGNLDQETAGSIVNMFRDLAHQQNKCVIVVTHSQQVADASDEVVTLQEGRLIRDHSKEL